jgi:hypothetical protein
MRLPSRKSGGPRTMVTPRDVELLLSLFRHRHLSVPQIERLHFPSMQTASRRLRLLRDAGYLSLFHAPGIPDRIAFLTRKGVEVVGEHLDAPVAELGMSRARLQPKDYYFLRHHLAVADFRIALTKACEARPDVRLLGFFADHVVERTDRGGLRRFTRDLAAGAARPGEKVVQTPDGVFALACGDAAALFFLEVDRGTETVSDRERGFARTLGFYLHYIAGGGYSRYQDVFGVKTPFTAVRVLVATSSRRRLDTIRSVGAALGFQPARALRLIWLTEIAAVTEKTIFDQIWVSLDPVDPARYRIAPEHDHTRSDEGALTHD